MSARRPLLTTAATGALLCALCFAPAAYAAEADTSERPTTGVEASAQTPSTGQPAPRQQAEAPAGGERRQPPAAPPDARLADSGSVDTTPYLVGGSAFLGLGVVLVAAATRRARAAAG